MFAQGDPANAIFYVQKGRVKLTVVSHHGKEAVVAILGATDFFGEGCLAHQVLRMATCDLARRVSDDEIREIARDPAAPRRACLL
ncbi:MAG: cyclic nucleotide-binding domain-containing protein [Candidatus Sulfopaludibacter sp.]|nr:cyclic nucleotide-binding domain-containing protein [Candidatus Sulfopaludibacter sp.]